MTYEELHAEADDCDGLAHYYEVEARRVLHVNCQYSPLRGLARMHRAKADDLRVKASDLRALNLERSQRVFGTDRVEGQYPYEPARGVRDTSHAAAKAIKPHNNPLERAVLFALAMRPMTTEELAAYIKHDYSGIQPRTSQLSQRGEIYDTGERRTNAKGRNTIVWGLTNSRQVA